MSLPRANDLAPATAGRTRAQLLLGRLGPRAASMERHVRYGLATLGPVSTAGSQFVLSLQLLHTLNQTAFGSYSFLLVASNLGTGFWSALFCAPMPILLSQGSVEARAQVLRCLLSAGLCAALIAFFVFFAIGTALSVPMPVSLLFAGYGAVMLLRWFARTYAYVQGVQWRTLTCDLVYGFVLLACILAMQFLGAPSLTMAYSGLLIAAALSLAPFGSSYLSRQFLKFSLLDALRYGEVWRVHSSWSLIGVATTEATSNAHAYIVTLLYGPAQFARVAASALLIRPVAVAMNALADFERPRLAREVASGSRQTATASIRFFRFALIGVWVATAILSMTLAVFAPRLIFPARYTHADIIIGGVLWLATAAVRLIRTPESTFLQAVGRFRPLAYASIGSAGVSVLAVVVFLALGGPLWSISGILLGEVVFAALIWRQLARWWAERKAAPVVSEPDAAGMEPIGTEPLDRAGLA